MQVSFKNASWNQKFFHNSACNLVESNSFSRTLFTIAMRVLLGAVDVKTVKELKRPSSNERRDESVRVNDTSFGQNFMFVELQGGFFRIKHVIPHELLTAVRNSRKVVKRMTSRVKLGTS